MSSRRHEWVKLTDGSVCVRQLTPVGLKQLMRLAYPGGRKAAPGLAWERNAAMVWLSCYDGEGGDAHRLFKGHDDPAIERLKPMDMAAIVAAVYRVNSGISLA